MTYLTDCNWIEKPYLDSKVNHHPTTPSLFKQTANKILKIKNSILFTIIFVAFAQVCWGQMNGDYRTKDNGDWNTYTIWQKYIYGAWVDAVEGDVPDAATNVTIQSNHAIFLQDYDGAVNNLKIDGTLSGTNSLFVYGNLTVNGTFTPTLGKMVTMSGADSPQFIQGTGVIDFFTLEISNLLGVTANVSFNIYNLLTIDTNCTFKTASSVVLNNSSPQGTVGGLGTLKVTSIDYSSQFKFSICSVDIIEYSGELNQVISANISYNTLVINNVNGCTLSGLATCNNLLISVGVLTVAPGGTLKVTNNTNLKYRAPLPVLYPLQIDYWSCLVLKSNATSTGSFTYNSFSGSGTVKVERFMSKTDNWHLYSSPMKDQSVNDFLKYNPEIPDLYDASNNIIGVGMRDYNIASDLWNPYLIYATSSTIAGSIGGGKGFSIRTFNDSQGTGSIDATGIPNLNTVNITLTRSTAAADNGWNCIGNPFCCAIKAGGPFGFLNNTNKPKLDPMYQFIYIWDSNTSQYLPINNLYGIQTGQGFFVKSIIGGGIVSFNKNMQNPEASLSFKDAETEYPSIVMIAKNLTFSSSTEITFIQNTTKGLDPGYDAGMLKANKDFALYSRLIEDVGVDFCLQSLPNQNYDQYVIPIGIDFKVGGDLTFSAETINLPSGCQALLEDRLTKRFTRLDLKDAKYTTTVSANTKGTGRFFLHTSDVISGDQPIEKEQFKISKIGKTLYINGEVSDKANFFVYSVNGKQLANFKAESQVQNQFDASGLPAGVYILTADDQNQKKSTKFVIEN